MLEQEFKYFIDNQDELVKSYNGEFIIIVGQKVLNAFPTLMEAYTYAKKNYTPGSYLIQHCIPGKEAYTVTITTNLLIPC